MKLCELIVVPRTLELRFDAFKTIEAREDRAPDAALAAAGLVTRWQLECPWRDCFVAALEVTGEVGRWAVKAWPDAPEERTTTLVVRQRVESEEGDVMARQQVVVAAHIVRSRREESGTGPWMLPLDRADRGGERLRVLVSLACALRGIEASCVQPELRDPLRTIAEVTRLARDGVRKEPAARARFDVALAKFQRVIAAHLSSVDHARPWVDRHVIREVERTREILVRWEWLARRA